MAMFEDRSLIPVEVKPGGKPTHYRKGKKIYEPVRDPYRRPDGDRDRSKFRKSKGEPRGRGKKNWLFLCITAVVVGGGAADAMELFSIPNFIDLSPGEPAPVWSVVPVQDSKPHGWRFYEHPPQEGSLFLS